jgi:hypothetical protein
MKDNKEVMHGTGRYTFASGAFYEGEWKEDKMNGYGTYQYRSGNQYRGMRILHIDLTN